MAWKGSNDGNGVVGVTTTLTTICTVAIPDGASKLWAEIALTSDAGSVDLDQFVVQVRPHASAGFHTIASATADYTTAIEFPMLGCSADLTAASDGSDYLFSMETRAINAVRFRAAMSGATSSDVEIAINWQVR